MNNLTWPAISKSQLVIALGWILSQAVSMNLIDSNTSEVLLSIGSSFIAFAWLAADAVVRHSRNKVVAAHVEKGSAPDIKTPLVG
jgi:hypothetical protein